MKVTIATWNILADCYSKAVRKGSNSTCTGDEFKAVLEWSCRIEHVCRCLTECSVDIICLQEVDHYADGFKTFLSSIDYETVYYKRPMKEDGCLIAFNSSKFRLIGVSEINLDDLAIINSGKKSGANSRNKFFKQNVAIMAQVQHISTSQLINVCTCHIHWNPNLLDVKLAQVKYVLAQLYQYRVLSLLKYQSANTASADENDTTTEPIPIIFTGDFNSMPNDFIYDTVTSSYSSISEISSIALSTEQLMASGCDLTGSSSGVVEQSGVAYSGAKTRFLCDATMYKLGKWMRVLGINVAIDGWESTNKTERTKLIEAFFHRARTEKRIILTTSKTLRERANCPHSVLISHGDMKQSLVDLYVEYRLPLNILNFLTVCIKCGDDILPVEADDPCLQGNKHIPLDRPLFACVSCFQPYWWSEEANSSPAKALRKAEDLYNIVHSGLQGRASTGCEVSRSILAAMQTRDCRDIVSGRRHDLEGNIHVDGMEGKEDQIQNNNSSGGNYMSDGPSVSRDSLLPPQMEGEVAETGEEEEEEEAEVQEESVENEADEESTPFENTPEGEEQQQDDITSSFDDVASSSLPSPPPHTLQLSSVFTRLERPEPVLTNWNGEFRATLDYIFVTDDWTVHSAQVWPRVVLDADTADGDEEKTINASHNASQINSDTFCKLKDIVVSTAQPSSLWPSDHFMILTELSLNE